MTSRLIEEMFPVKEISLQSSKGKGSKKGYISSFHTWWARRPLSASRSVNYSSLIDYIQDSKELEAKLKFIVNLSKWENSNSPTFIANAQMDILHANKDVRPKVLDPFLGGGQSP